MSAPTATGVSLLDGVFASARAEKRAALIGYLPAGFPSYDRCIEGCRAMVDAGVDVIEVGLPYSDPLMDGPTIQAAADLALAGGTGTACSRCCSTATASASTTSGA